MGPPMTVSLYMEDVAVKSLILSVSFLRQTCSLQIPASSRNLTLIGCTFLTAILVLFAPVSPLFAQKAPIKWGKIDKAMLEMESFPQDTNAAAVVLCEFGESYITGQFTLDYKVHRRIKIVKEAGYDWGTVAISYYAKDRSQVVKSIKGQTFTLSPDGEVVKHKLDKKSIFEEDVDGKRKRKKFTLPKLQPGAIIEYQYTIQSKSPLHLRGWSFQNSEPTLISEYRVWIPDFVRYVWVFQGETRFDVQETNAENRFQLTGKWKRWVKRDVPALRREPYMTTPEDFRARVRLQLAEINVPGEFTHKYLTSWDELAKELIEDREFGMQCDKKGLLPKDVQADIEGLDSAHKKIEAAFDYVRKTIKWDGTNRLFVEGSLKDALKARSASGAEMAFMLISILRELDFDANPVILSTRDHGRIVHLYPLVDQFNYVVAHVTVDDQTYMLDATSPLRPYNLLPPHALNNVGWLVRKDNPKWLKLGTAGKLKKRTVVAAQLAESGKITGQINCVDYDYSALQKRKHIQDNDKDAYVEEYFLSDIFGAVADSFKVSELESEMNPLATTVYFGSDEAVQVAGDFMYVNPMLLDRYEENPFKLAKRTFPVDYSYARDVAFRMNLTLPAGYTVVEQPKNVALRLPNSGGIFRRVVQVNGKTLSVLSMLKIDKTVFAPEEYAGLREFYGRMVSACVFRSKPATCSG